MIEDAMKAEREACAQIADYVKFDLAAPTPEIQNYYDCGALHMGANIADAIRARNSK